MMDGVLIKLERDTNATIKAILTELEEVAKLSPERATDILEYAERRKRVVKRIWALSSRVLAAMEGLNDGIQ